MGVIKADTNELVFANADLASLLQRAGMAGPGAQAAWLLSSAHPADGYEIQTADLGGFLVVTARLAPSSRLEQLIDRLVRRYGLSASEHKELRHLARGLAIKDSARELGLSPETVRVRRKRVYRKMGLGGHEALLARICQEALIAPSAHDDAARAG
jgi:DNA-binding CsgD family transcriptional regulator